LLLFCNYVVVVAAAAAAAADALDNYSVNKNDFIIKSYIEYSIVYRV
jgi:hypothetical protein